MPEAEPTIGEPKRPTTPRPLLEGPPEVEEGYYDLEEHERNQMWVALREQQDAAALWYRALTQYRRAMLGNWTFAGMTPGTDELKAKNLQMRLLGLAVSPAKSSLDDLLAGYYSQAFGGIRFLLETFAQCCYLDFHPDETEHWYEQPGGIAAQVDPPSMQEMCRAIQAEAGFAYADAQQFADRLYNSWHLMSKGAHPSGVGIRQTEGADDAKSLIGATYRPDLCLAGFDIGLFALATLLPRALKIVKPQIGAWAAEWERIGKDAGEWRASREAELRAAQGTDLEARTTSAPPRPVPQVRQQDAERCWKLLQLRLDQMNHMPIPASRPGGRAESTAGGGSSGSGPGDGAA
jgi:hypothetical protein